MHKLLQRQVARLRRAHPEGELNVDELLQVVSQTYDEADRERRLGERAGQLMESELRAANERAREQAAAHLKAILEAVGEGVVIASHQGVILDVNHALTDIFGYPREALLGQNLRILMDGDDAQAHDGHVGDYTHGRRPPTIIGRGRESVARRHDGSLFPIDLSVGDLSATGYRQFVGIIRDVTVRKRSEQALADSKRQLVTAVSSISEGFVLYDADDRIVLCNDKFRRIFAPIAEWLVPGTCFADLVRHGVAQGMYRVPESLSLEAWLAMRMAAHAQGEQRYLEQALSDGRTVRIMERRTPDGGVVGIVTDVSESLQLEEQLRRARDAAEEASYAKSNFLATMSHEIRTPMNGVIGMTSLLLDTGLDEEQRHFAGTIRDSAEGLLSIINDILDFSKMEAHRLELEDAEFELPALVESVVDILAPRAHGKGIEIACLIESQCQYIARGDPGRIRQILMNLAGNAVKFTANGGVSLFVMPGRDGWVRFEIQDTGIGIPDSARTRLFTMFTQVDASTARRFGGTGLGLAISKRLVEAMGGDIGFDSMEGKGSVFWFELPLLKVGSCRAMVPDLAGKRILLVDDHAVNLDVLRRMLAASRARIMVAASADEAMALLAQHDFDLALLDYLMPDVSGAELACRIRANPRWQHMALMLATSHPLRHEHDVHDLFRLTLIKPLRQQTVLTSVASALGVVTPQAAPHAGAEVVSASPAMVKLRILVAEDNPVNQQVALGLLRKGGHSVQVVGNGEEAVTAVRSLPFDLVFMDVQMPVMDGLQATRLIREAGIRVPIVAMTANAMPGDAQICLDAGMDGYVPKPINRAVLDAVLQDYAMAPEAGAGAGVAVLDEEVLQVLQDEFGTDIITQLLETFFSDAAARQLRIAQAVSPAPIAIELHSLKGSAATLGLSGIQQLCAQLELKAGSDGAAVAQALAQQLAEAQRQLAQWQAGQQAM